MNSDIIQLSEKIGRLKASKEEIIKRHGQIAGRITNLEEEAADLKQCLDIVRLIGNQTQQRMETALCAIGNAALKSVFGDKYEFKTQFILKRNQTELEILLVNRENGSILTPVGNVGGGVIDLLSMSLRLTMWTLQNPRSRPIMVLDEPFKFLSKNLKPLAAEMLKTLAAKMNIQFIIVTHESEIVEIADKTITIGE